MPAVPVLVHRLRVLAIVDGVSVARVVVELRDRNLGILIMAFPAFRRLLHFACFTLRSSVH